MRPPSPPDEDVAAITEADDTEPSVIERAAGVSEALAAHVTADDLDDLATRYAEAIDDALDRRSELEGRWQTFLRSYHGIPDASKKNWPWKNASNIVVNLVGSFTDSVVARIMGSLFGPEPFWFIKPLGTGFDEAAKSTERFLEWSRRNTWDQYRITKHFVLDVTKLGTGIIFTGFRNESYRRIDAEGQTVDAGSILGPDPRWVPREDFVHAPGFTTIDESPWVAVRSWFSDTELQRIASRGEFENVETILAADPDPETEMRAARRELSRETDAEDTASGPIDSNGNRTSALRAVWTVWFREDLDRDGYPEDHVLTLWPNSSGSETKAVPLRLVANPYSYRMRPFVKACFVEVEGAFDGLGVPEMAEHYQAEVSTIHNQRRDNSTLQNTTAFVVEKGAGAPDNLRLAPGDTIPLRRVDAIRELRIGQTAQMTLPEEQYTVALAEERIGITDTNQGRIPSPVGRAAATTVVSALQEGIRRFDLSTAEIRSALAAQGGQILELWSTHGLPAPGQLGSPETAIGEGPGAQVRELFETSTGTRGLLGVQLNVATAALNREVEKQSSIQLFELTNSYLMQILNLSQMLAAPDVPPPIRTAVTNGIKALDRIMERTYQAHQTYDLDQFLASEALEQLGAPPQMPPGAPGAPGAPAGPEGAPPMDENAMAQQLMAQLSGAGTQ